MDKLLTVVIPAYNIEKYEEQCLSSFVKPKALPEIEVLVVNDGSSDRTVEIAEGYVKKYPEIFRVISKENGVSVPMWPFTLSGRLLIVALVGRYLTN